jgi:3-deoxy-D-manno-octulosonate 8-phosphate phosphatase (KDO 8-P phosphatase)
VLAAFKHIQCFVFDVDGVLTNGTLLVMPGGLMARTMNIKDGYAIQLAIKKGYKIWVISGGNSEEVKERLNRLGVEEVYMKVSDKAELLKELAILNKIELANILYMGDDMPDYEAMKLVGILQMR